MELIWLVPALPLAGFVLLAFGRSMRGRTAGIVGSLTVGLSAVSACIVACALRLARAPRHGHLRDQPVALARTRIGLPRHRLLGGRPLRNYDPRRHDRRLPHPSLLHRAYGGRGGLSSLLRLHEPLRSLHADPRAGGQLPPPLPGLGRRGSLQLPPHRFLVSRQGERRALRARLSSSRASATSPSCSESSCWPPTSAASASARPRGAPRRPGPGVGHGRAGGRPHPGRGPGQIGPASPAYLAARRDGRPLARERPHPRGYHGHRRRLPGRALQRLLRPRAAR